MTAIHDSRIEEEAIAWHIRLAQDDDDVWDRFAEWLEADPRNNAAYEAIADADRALDGVAREMAVRETDNVQPEIKTVRVGWSSSRGWGIAASLVLIFGTAWFGYGQFDDSYEVTTRAGEMRRFALADGTRIAVNGGTRLILHRRDPRSAQLLAGEARFIVQHDDTHPFTLNVDGQRIVDVGTVFNVRKTPRALRVEVAEGAVRFESGEVRLRLNAGDTLDADAQTLREGSRPVSSIGSWVDGKLVYHSRSLADVSVDLSRALGIAIELAPDVSTRSFTGIIQLDGDDETVRARVEQLLGLKVDKTADGWTISP
ncbi:FecR family protein [Novosphingobium pentaromativorans]|uniref:Anti-FecI sigma factor, FecR n=1 Tax=Novosphingobium pentaromativorans US6-1 TaxID=1088721 RepID=G6EDL4_9SPHN|nr:FecR domain-containing protein [Novosphingobium pentaromativorans]AIT79712.1 hypothetical protein JI59_07920 [Novosphingobium pentaromativorans US6-1]EHJ60642.1 hypothetical protein NSU_2435 [Novosphingobium pentaromativorans US6-1]